MMRPVPPSADLGTTLSRNETDSLCTKAARGAGFSWGLAEEAGFAMAALVAVGIDVTGPYLAFLRDRQARPAAHGRPVIGAGHWQGREDGPLCPIATGAALADCARLPEGPFGGALRLDPVALPILLLPFLSRAVRLGVRLGGCALTLTTAQGRVAIGPDGSFDPSAGMALLTAVPMTLHAANLPPVTMPPTALPVIAPEVLEGLAALALLTTVPATDVSRRGAGSATTDND